MTAAGISRPRTSGRQGERQETGPGGSRANRSEARATRTPLRARARGETPADTAGRPSQNAEELAPPVVAEEGEKQPEEPPGVFRRLEQGEQKRRARGRRRSEFLRVRRELREAGARPERRTAVLRGREERRGDRSGARPADALEREAFRELHAGGGVDHAARDPALHDHVAVARRRHVGNRDGLAHGPSLPHRQL